MVTVVKIGGNILGRGLSSSVIDDVKNLLLRDKVVIVHGGGDKVTEFAKKIGKEQKFIVSPGGIRSRYTDKETVEIYTMVMTGKINKEIVATLQRHAISAVGVSGIDAELLKAKRKKRLIIIDERGRKRIIDGGYTGKIGRVNAMMIQLLLENNFIPVVAPVAIGEEYEFLNVDGDRAAAYVAGALKAENIIFLTDVKGVFLKDRLVREITVNDAKKILPEIGFGMKTKVLASIEAISLGVKEAIITSGLEENPISSALNHKVGTVIMGG